MMKDFGTPLARKRRCPTQRRKKMLPLSILSCGLIQAESNLEAEFALEMSWECGQMKPFLNIFKL